MVHIGSSGELEHTFGSKLYVKAHPSLYNLVAGLRRGEQSWSSAYKKPCVKLHSGLRMLRKH